jgi:hypothetical protein
MKTLIYCFFILWLGRFRSESEGFSFEDPHALGHPEIEKEEDGNSVKININLKNDEKKKQLENTLGYVD